MTNQLIDLLCCPVTHKKLKAANRAQLHALNGAIRKGQVQSHGGMTVREEVQDGLVTVDERTLYRIDDGIPVLLEDEAIALAQLDH